MLKKLLSIVTLVAGLVACSTTLTISEQPQVPDAVELRTYWLRESAFVWEGYRIVAVDSKFIDITGFETVLRVGPGERTLAIHAKFNRGLLPGPSDVFIQLKANLLPSRQYQLTGRVNGPLVEVWLVDVKTSVPATEIATARW